MSHIAVIPDLIALRQVLNAIIGPAHMRDHVAGSWHCSGGRAKISRRCRRHSPAPSGPRSPARWPYRPDRRPPVTPRSDLVLQATRMAFIAAICPDERVAVVHARVALEALQSAVTPLRSAPGIDLAARGTARIGRMVSTNAGGIIAVFKWQEADLWRLREDIDPLYRAHAATPPCDACLPLSEIMACDDHSTRSLARICCCGIEPDGFGHLADGKLHIMLNRASPLDTATSLAVEHVPYAPLHALGGSFFAKHRGRGQTHVRIGRQNGYGKVKHDVVCQAGLGPRMIMDPSKILPLQPSVKEKSE